MPKNAARTHLSTARLVGRMELKPLFLVTSIKLILNNFTHNKTLHNPQKRLSPTKISTKRIPDTVKIRLCEGTEVEPKKLDEMVQNLSQ
jgi:hypothetical protein